MKNANIFIDVDLTLIDARGRLRDGSIEALQLLKDKGCHLYLWSTCGQEYCQKIAKLNHLESLFEGYAGKPDIIIDDMPSTVLNPFHFDVQCEASWIAMAKKIIDKHLD
jgi:phosphoglycolate phosphatase-like HAD superfamily hydrolase